MMFLQRIQKNKLLQAVISVILCIVLMFCIVSKPFEVKVNAIAGLDDAIFWAIVAALLQFGIVIEVSNPEARQAVADFFWSLTDQLRDEIGIAAAFWRQGYSVYYNWAVESWSNIAHAISEWFTTDHYPQSPIICGNVSVSNNAINFYTPGSFSFTFPALSSSDTNIQVVFPVNNCDIQYVFNYNYRFADYWIYGSTTGTDYVRRGWYLIIITPHDYDFSYVAWVEGLYPSTVSGNTYSFESANFTSLDYMCISSRCSANNSTLYSFFNQSYCRFASGNKRYDLCQVSNGYSFVNRKDSTDIYNDLVFDSCFDALAWFWDLCGINIRQGSSSVYIPGQTVVNPVDIDPATVQAALDNIESLPADSTVPVILPGTETQYRQLVSSVPVSSLYDADIDMPTVDGNLWKTKFPFCIPFDLINLFSGFSAEAQAPSFHVLVMPANSFGLNNEAVYWDIDFAPYNYLVQILRFFLALSFVLWLIVITRKLIRG